MMFAILQWPTGRTMLVECQRPYKDGYLPHGAAAVEYYTGPRKGAERRAHKVAVANTAIRTVVRPLQSGRWIKNSWSIMAESGYPLG